MARARGLSGRKALVGIAAVAAGVILAAAGAAATGSNGYDISYPQCNGAFPSGGAFDIVGVNGGKPYSPNPCLGTGSGPSELAWAGLNAELYANTANPGPALSTHWPNGQTSPKECNTPANPGSDTPACAYDYGWNSAADSYQDAVAAYVSLGWAPAGATRTPVQNTWWLDVETANSWRTDTSLNVAALQGAADYLGSVSASSVGFYSAPGAWSTIVGTATAFAAYPSWLAGATSLADAQSRCGGAGFTGGGIALVQYPSGGFDGDYRCAAQPALTFTSAPQTLVAGDPSGPMSVGIPQPAGSDVTLSLTSDAPTGQFSTSPSGPWAATLSVSIPAGSSTSSSFYYTDTKAGNPTVTATASGYADATQTQAVTAGALASLVVSPSSARVRLGGSQSFSASGADHYGNPVSVSPTWSVSPALGSFSPNPGTPVTFSATAVGTGQIVAAADGIQAKASITVSPKKRR